LSPRVDPWVFLVIPRTYFRANIPDTEGGFVLAYNLMMFAIVAVCLAVIHLAFDERQRRRAKHWIAGLIASMKEWRG
jgi:phosphotransferase system  glucose/maltose/N-acetylglucosamine-specific IIC component